jgi:hypothetical protein
MPVIVLRWKYKNICSTFPPKNPNNLRRVHSREEFKEPCDLTSWVSSNCIITIDVLKLILENYKHIKEEK